MERDPVPAQQRKGWLAGPAVGLTGPQMAYAASRSARAAPAVDAKQQQPQSWPAPTATAGSAGWQPGTPSALAARADRVAVEPPARARPMEDEQALPPAPPPLQPPVVFASSAAAVRVKEQQVQPPLAVRPGLGDDEYQRGAAAAGEEGEVPVGEVDALPIGGGEVTAVATQEEAGLLAKVADAANNAAGFVANKAAEVAAVAVPAARSVLGQGAEAAAGGFEAARDTAEAVTESVQADEGATEKAQGAEEAGEAPAAGSSSAQAPLQRPAVPSAATPRTAVSAPEAKATAATVASVMPASAGTPAATGTGYFPVVGVSTPAPKPAPRPSGDLEARNVAVERLSGMAAEAEAGVGPAPSAKAAGRGARGRRGGDAGMDEDWISELVERLWPYTKAAVEQMAWETLPDILEASEPSWIHDLNLKKFQLGNTEPDLSNIRVFMDENDVMDDCFLEFDFEWHSQQDVELEIQVLPANMDKAWIPDFVENKLKDLLTFQVGIEDAMLKGRVRLTMRPLLNRMPVVGALQVSLLEPPVFDFDLTMGGSTNVPLEPSLKSWIKQTLEDAAFKTYGLPEHYFLQIDPEAQDLECPTGVLVVEVVEGRKVPRMDLFTRSSPYVDLFVRTSQRRSTSIKNTTRKPRWNESFELPVHVPEHQELTLILYDYDWASANDEIGRASLKVADLQPGQTRDMWLDVTSKGEEELAAAKGDMKKRDRAKVAAAKPLVKGNTKGCQLHLKVTYHAFTDEEEKLIASGRRTGMQAMLDSPQGRRMSPALRNLLLSGSVQVQVPRAEDLPISSLFGRPSVSCNVRCGGEQREMPAVKASRRGGVHFDAPVELHLGANVTQDPNATVTVELREGGWFGGGEIGSVKVLVKDLIERKHIHEGLRLEGVDTISGRVEVDAHWKPYFY